MDQLNHLRNFYNNRSSELLYKIIDKGHGSRYKVASYLANKTGVNPSNWMQFIKDQAVVTYEVAPWSLMFSLRRKIFVDLIDGKLDEILKG